MVLSSDSKVANYLQVLFSGAVLKGTSIVGNDWKILSNIYMNIPARYRRDPPRGLANAGLNFHQKDLPFRYHAFAESTPSLTLCVIATILPHPDSHVSW